MTYPSQGEAGLPLPRGPREIEDFVGWVQTPTVLPQTVAAFPPVVGDGQRLAALGHNSIGPAEPGLPATPHQT